MMKISALFLVLLLAPIAFAQSDIIELIEKSSEGKEVLDNIYLQVSVQGKTIDVKGLKEGLNKFDKRMKLAQSTRVALMKKVRADCKADLVGLKGRFHDLTIRALSVRRTLSLTKNNQRIRARFLSRSSEELGHFRKFNAMTISGGAAWGKFWASRQDNIRRVSQLLEQARSQLGKVHATALIELPESYNLALTDITAQFENTLDSLNGLRPVISNFLEICRSKGHLTNENARGAMRKLLGSLQARLHAQANTASEENEHQKAIFSSLGNLFSDAVSRTSRVVSSLAKAQDQSVKKIGYLIGGVSGAENLAGQARNVVDLRMNECRFTIEEHNKLTVRLTRIIGVVNTLQEVIADRWSSLHSYFIQRMDNNQK